MAALNHVGLVGRLTRDAELKYTNSGLAIANFSVAVNRRVKRDETWQDEAHFFDAVLFGRRAEALAKYLVKGKLIGLQGELRQDRWEQDGQRRSKVQIAVDDIEFVGGGGGGGGRPGGSEYRGSDATGGVDPGPPDTDRGPRQESDYGGGGGGGEAPTADDFDDDIPF